MAFDPSKLTPMPWMFTPPGHIDYPAVVKKSGWPILLSEDDNADDLAFATLARNAFDVMMTLRWYSVPRDADGKEWIALNAFGVPIERHPNGGSYFVSGDPFSCLVEARALRHE